MIPFSSPMALILSITLLFGSFASGGRSQNRLPKPGERTCSTKPQGQTQSRAEVKGEKKANKKQKQVGEEVKNINSRRDSANIQAAAAYLLFPYREEHARELFQQAFNTAVAHYQETLDVDRRQLSQNSWTLRNDVRVEVIELINKGGSKMRTEFNEKFVEASECLRLLEHGLKEVNLFRFI